MVCRAFTVGCCLALSIQPTAAVVSAFTPSTGPAAVVPGAGVSVDPPPDVLSLDVSTLIAGGGDDGATAVTFDHEGNFVVVGTTRSWGELGPEGGRYGPGGERDVFVACLRRGDGSMLWVSYLGGRADDRAWALRADASGVYIVGETTSADFPTRGGVQGALAGSSDCFIAKLANGGGSLRYSTYYGAEGADRCLGLAVDSLGAAYASGQFDNGVDFDGLLVKVAPDGGSVEYAVLLTTLGWGNEVARAVAVDAAHCAYVTGGSSGAGSDVFVVKVDPTGTDALYSRTLGGSAYDIGLALAVDSTGTASVAGETDSANFAPLVNPMQGSNAGSPDGFVAMLDPEGRILFSTYLGGVGGDGITGLALDASGALVLSGNTNSEDLPLVAPLQDRLGGSEDAWVARLDPQAGALRLSSYLGGSQVDAASAVAVDAGGRVVVVGSTTGADFPRWGSPTAPAGATDAFVAVMTPGFETWIPSVAHSPGAGGTQWRTDVTVVNRSDLAADLTLTFRPYGGGAPIAVTERVDAGATTLWPDLLAGALGLPGGQAAKGVVEVSSTQPLHVVSRTFNAGAAGTYGQYLPAVLATETVAIGEVGLIPLLRKSTSFRSNLGLLNPSDLACSADVRVFAANGREVGSVTRATVAAGTYWQANDVFATVGAAAEPHAYATVEVVSPRCSMWAYGSIVDEATGDPTTVPVVTRPGQTRLFVPAAAHAPGAAGTNWRTDLALVNVGSATATVRYTFRPVDGSAERSRTGTVAAAAMVEHPDVLVSLFGLGSGDPSKGTVEVSSSQRLVGLARTYNESPDGTFGQYMPAVGEDDAIISGRTAVVAQLRKSSSFRSNLGAVNVGPGDCEVSISLFAADGRQLGTTRAVDLEVGRYWQADDVFSFLQAPDADPAYATVEVVGDYGHVWVYGSVIDASTGDPTTIPGLVR